MATAVRRMDRTEEPAAGHRPRVVILGGGFAGLYAAKALGRADVDITVIDRTNHHLFQPLLYQVATATLTPSDITSPIRYLLRRQRNSMVLMADVQAIDVVRRVVVLDGAPHEVAYDYLIVATGARHSYFGREEWEPLAPGLKSVEDAREIRRRFLIAFEEAEKAPDPAEQAAYLTFVVVGGGPTGVELAGMLPDVARRALRRDFRRIDTRNTRVILLEGGPRLLPAFPDRLCSRATRDLQGLGVEVRTNALVTGIEEGAVYVGDERIAAKTVLWAAGNAASPVARSLGVPLDRVGRVLVEPDLSIPGHPEVFVAGDLAAVDRGGGTARSCRAWRRRRCSRGGTPRAPSCVPLAASRAPRSATATRGTWRPSAATARSPISAAFASPARLPGGSGCSSTSYTWLASAIV